MQPISQSTPFNIQTTADDNLKQILSYLPKKDLLSITLASKKMKSVADDDQLWQSLCQKDYPNAKLISGRTWKSIYQVNASGLSSVLVREFENIKANYHLVKGGFVKLDALHFQHFGTLHFPHTIFNLFIGGIVTTGVLQLLEPWRMAGMWDCWDRIPDDSIKMYQCFDEVNFLKVGFTPYVISAIPSLLLADHVVAGTSAVAISISKLTFKITKNVLFTGIVKVSQAVKKLL